MVRARKTPPDGRANNGGVRQGTPGTAYAQRSDMRTQKVTTAPGQTYGKATAQAEAQKAVPLAGPAAGLPAGQDAHAAAAAFPMPSFGAFDRPTERPAEPLTHGAPTGPGAGPEILPGMGAAPAGMAGLLRSIAGATGSSDLAELAARAESLGR